MLHAADQTRAQHEHAEQRRSDDHRDMQDGHTLADEEHRRIHGEDERDDECRDGKAQRLESRRNGLGLGNGSTGGRGKGDGRRDIGDDAVVEDEHMRNKRLKPHAGDENGRAGGAHDDVVRGGGDAHAHQDAADGCHQQGEEEIVAGDPGDDLDKHRAETGHGDNTCHDARDAAGAADGQRVLRTVFKTADELVVIHAVILVEQGDDDAGDGGDDGGAGHGIALSHHEDEHDKRDDQVQLGQHLAGLGQLIAGNAAQTFALCLEVNHNEHAGEVKDRGEDGLHGDGGIGNADHFRHQKRRGAHDGRHDLTAGGGGRLDCAGKLGRIAGLFHHRNGDRAGTNGVGNGGAGDHSFQRGGDDCDLRRTTGRPAADHVGQLDKEIADAC